MPSKTISQTTNSLKDKEAQEKIASGELSRPNETLVTENYGLIFPKTLWPMKSSVMVNWRQSDKRMKAYPPKNSMKT